MGPLKDRIRSSHRDQVHDHTETLQSSIITTEETPRHYTGNSPDQRSDNTTTLTTHNKALLIVWPSQEQSSNTPQPNNSFNHSHPPSLVVNRLFEKGNKWSLHLCPNHETEKGSIYSPLFRLTAAYTKGIRGMGPIVNRHHTSPTVSSNRI